MQLQDSGDDDLIQIKARDFKCPCGKTYLSYAALFTHIKQKHDGQAPGKITKPPSLHEKRGRPPVKPKNDNKDTPRPPDTELPTYSEPLFPPETQAERLLRLQTAEQAIAELANILQSMPDEGLNKAYLNEIEVFGEMNVYLNTRGVTPSYAGGNLCVADGLIQFAQLVCARIRWSKFQPFYLLFMLFLQYIVDEENSKKILSDSNMDLFCEYINDFVEDHMTEMAEYYEFEGSWLVRKENSVRVFFQFFRWCTAMRYVTYRVNLSGGSDRS